METLRRFLGRTISGARLSDRATLARAGFRERWIPDPPDEFDEIEVARSLDGERDLVVTAALERGAVARILLGWSPAGDDEADRRAFAPEELPAVLEAHGEAVEALLGTWCGD